MQAIKPIYLNIIRVSLMVAVVILIDQGFRLYKSEGSLNFLILGGALLCTLSLVFSFVVLSSDKNQH